MVGETTTGEPIVEVRSARLVLPDGASHFRRFARCTRCERELYGSPVLGPSDLDEPLRPVICADCIQTAAPPLGLRPDRPHVEGVAGRVNSGDERPQDDDRRLAALERRVSELAELLEGQRADAGAVLQGHLQEARVEARALAAKELARAQEDVDRMMKGVV